MSPQAARSRRPAFTIIEVLVAITIVLVIAAISVAVAAGAKERAKVGTDMSNLRSIGQAAQLYASDYDEVHPLSVAVLQSARPLPNQVLKSPSEVYGQGHLQALVQFVGSPLSVPAGLPPVSYIGVGDGRYTWDKFQAEIGDKPGAGWLVCAVRTLSDPRRPLPGNGPFMRLGIDGSVIVRQHKRSPDEPFVFPMLYHD